MASQSRFKYDVYEHQMTIELDQGVHRSILFKNPRTFAYHFWLVTWPGHLAISGDMGDYTFSRLRDMFEFFRHAGPAYDRTDRINEGYWAEKLGAVDKHGGVEQLSEKKFKQAVLECFERWTFEDAEQKARSLAYLNDDWDGLLGCPPQNLSDAMHAVGNYQCPVTGQRFGHYWDHNVSEYSFHLVWCMHAIQWGIKRYDLVKEGRTQADHDRRVLAGQL